MASYFIFLVLAVAFVFTSAENGAYATVPVRSTQIPSNATVKAVSLATGVTNTNDKIGLLALVSLAPSLLLEAQQDDPCLPQALSWIACSNDPSPRVTALYLGKRGLYGSIPDFSFMDALVKIDMHGNTLFGTIPPFLGRLPRLEELDLSDNLLTGTVPDSLTCNKDLKYSVSGNSDLSTSSQPCRTSKAEAPATRTNTESPASRTNNGDAVSGESSDENSSPTSTSRGKKSKLPLILGITGSVFGVSWIAIGIFAIFRHKAKAAAAVAAASAAGANDVPNKSNLTPHPNASSVETHRHPNMSPNEETPMNPRV